VKIKTYTELHVWQKAHELALAAFQITERFPRSDQFGIVSQVRRFASAVPANICQGFGRGTTKEFIRSLQIARGELEATRYFLFLSKDLGRISKEEFNSFGELCDSIGKLMNALGSSLKTRLIEKPLSLVTSHQSRSHTTFRN
jgi:four helix bundle protein